MLRLTNMKIPARIAIACLLPLLAFSIFAGKDLLEKRHTYAKTSEIAAIAENAHFTTELVHELQKERGLSIGFIVSKGQTQADAMRSQRALVDKALAAWQPPMADVARTQAGSKFARDIDGAKTKLSSLSSTRSNVDSTAL